MSYAVAIVVDANFGSRLFELAKRVDVWVCASSENSAAVRRLWQDNVMTVTEFKVSLEDDAEAWLLDVLSDVDLHHGVYSHDPPWDSLEVYGCSASPQVRNALQEYGSGEVVDTVAGFRFKRHGVPPNKSLERTREG
ncbi:MAG TPA: hypothetical protein PKD26_09805 [Pyrinomonadaceae bacterium]|nr:hypothetical protein [Pyrinomonadaceae bacterium]